MFYLRLRMATTKDGSSKAASKVVRIIFFALLLDLLAFTMP